MPPPTVAVIVTVAVTVTVSVTGTVSVTVRVRVSDRDRVTGVGHPPEHRPHLVEQCQDLLGTGAWHRPGPGQQLQVHRKLPG